MEKESLFSSNTVSSGYSSSSGTNLNVSLASPYKVEHNTTAIINNYEQSNKANFEMMKSETGFASYVTGGSNCIGCDNSFDEKKHELFKSDSKFLRKLKSNNRDETRNFDVTQTEKLSSPLVNDEILAQEVLAKAGPANTYQRNDYKNDIGSLASELNQCHIMNEYANNEYDEQGNLVKADMPTFSGNSSINQDPSPIRIVKPNNQQNIVYKQQVNIRYLQPPTPPPPAPIIIREKQLAAPPKLPPIIIR